MWRRIGILLCLAVLVGVGAFLVGKRIAFARAFAKIEQTAPKSFVIHMQENVFSGDKSRVLGEYHFLKAVRHDGSFAYSNLDKAPDGSWRIVSRKLKLISERKTAIVFDTAGLVSSFTLTNEQALGILRAWEDTSCNMSGYSVAGEETILGYRVIKQERENQQFHERLWDAPDLACLPLKAVFDLKRPDGTIETETEQNALSVKEGEPPAEMFGLSRNYVEVPPSELHRRGMQSSNRVAAESDAMKQKLQKLDQAYEQHKFE